MHPGNDKHDHPPPPPAQGYPAPGAGYYGQPSVPPVQAPYQQQQPYHYPPPQQSQNWPRRRTSPFIVFFIGFLVTLVIAMFIALIVLRPTHLKFYVDSASLSRFNLTDGSRLGYDFKAGVSIRNTNKKIGVYYDYLEADVYYDGNWFGSNRLPYFYQGHKSTAALSPVFTGDSTFVDLGNGGTRLYDAQKSQGAFDIELRLFGLIRYKIGGLTTRRRRLRVKCWLPGVRLATNTTGGKAPSYPWTKCNID